MDQLYSQFSRSTIPTSESDRVFSHSYPKVYPPDNQKNTKPARRYRMRGVTLTQQGWLKLQKAGVIADESGKRYTYEELGERARLDARTVSRILGGEVKVDKRTLQIFFQAFNLQLEVGDYTTPIDHCVAAANTAIAYEHLKSNFAHLPIEMKMSVEELLELRQQMIEEYSRIIDQWLGLDKIG